MQACDILLDLAEDPCDSDHEMAIVQRVIDTVHRQGFVDLHEVQGGDRGVPSKDEAGLQEVFGDCRQRSGVVRAAASLALFSPEAPPQG